MFTGSQSVGVETKEGFIHIWTTVASFLVLGWWQGILKLLRPCLEEVTITPAYAVNWKHTPSYLSHQKKKKKFDKSLLQSPTLRELSQAVSSLPPGDRTALALALYFSVAQAVCQLPKDLPVLQVTGGGGAGQMLPVNKESPEYSQENPGGVQGRKMPSAIRGAGCGGSLLGDTRQLY